MQQESSIKRSPTIKLIESPELSFLSFNHLLIIPLWKKTDWVVDRHVLLLYYVQCCESKKKCFRFYQTHIFHVIQLDPNPFIPYLLVSSQRIPIDSESTSPPYRKKNYTYVEKHYGQANFGLAYVRVRVYLTHA